MPTPLDPSNPYGFDPTYGYTLDTLKQVGCPPIPTDFAAFWQRTYDEARSIPPHATMRERRRSKHQIVYDIEFDAWNLPGEPPFRVGGWMTVPINEPVTTGVVVGHGYGGRAGPDAAPPLPNAAVIYPCARGFNRSARPDLPNNSDAHVLFGIESKETYIHRGCVTDPVGRGVGIDRTCSRDEANGSPTPAGAASGGGIGALAVPWEPRFRRAFLDFPSFGNYPIRLQLPCVGSGEAVRRFGGEKHLPVLQYFDAAAAAAFTHTPTLVAAALYDPAVQPPGQFAVYNCLAGEKQLFVREAAHVEYAGQAEEDARLRPIVERWLQFPV